jgi:acyl carrier protein
LFPILRVCRTPISESMTKNEFRNILEDLLSPDSGTLQDADTRASVENWSSLVDVQILAVISAELGLEADRELLNYESVGALLAILERRKAFH